MTSVRTPRQAPLHSAKAYLDDEGRRSHVSAPAPRVDEVALAAQALVSDGVEAVFTPTDNTIMKSELTIYETFADAGIPHYTGADSFALNGAFLGYGVDYANLGVETADMIADILLDGKDPATTAVSRPSTTAPQPSTRRSAQQLGYDFDDTVARRSPRTAPRCSTIVTAESFDDVQNQIICGRSWFIAARP